jgi:hypothetical protein
MLNFHFCFVFSNYSSNIDPLCEICRIYLNCAVECMRPWLMLSLGIYPQPVSVVGLLMKQNLKFSNVVNKYVSENYEVCT